jgi:hypothetical protein
MTTQLMARTYKARQRQARTIAAHQAGRDTANYKWSRTSPILRNAQLNDNAARNHWHKLLYAVAYGEISADDALAAIQAGDVAALCEIRGLSNKSASAMLAALVVESDAAYEAWEAVEDTRDSLLAGTRGY